MLRAQGLSKIYQSGEVEVHALRSVDLSCDRRAGRTAGPSGSGKSTLLNILGGLDTATAEVWFREHELTLILRYLIDPLSPRARWFRVPVLQFDPEADGARERGARDEIAPHPMLPERHCGWLGWRAAETFSRAALRRRTTTGCDCTRDCQAPDLLLCDEPTGALDSQTGVLVLEPLRPSMRARHLYGADHPQRRYCRHGESRACHGRRQDHSGKSQRPRVAPQGSSRGDARLDPEAAARPVAHARSGAVDRARGLPVSACW